MVVKTRGSMILKSHRGADVMGSFHLSLVVPDLEAVRTFYVNVLGCQVGRDRGSWIDVLFFGHQLTMHQEKDSMPAVAVDHFGPVVDKATWSAIAETCRSQSVEFARPIRVVGEGTRDESGKYVIVVTFQDHGPPGPRPIRIFSSCGVRVQQALWKLVEIR